MSVSKQEIVNNVLTAIQRRGDARTRGIVEGKLNSVVYSLSERHSWHDLRRPITLDLADATDEDGEKGLWLPSNVAGVDAVYHKGQRQWLVRRDEAHVDDFEQMPRYYVHVPDCNPLFFGTDAEIDKGGTTFLSEELDDDYTGQWIRFGNNESGDELTYGFHKLTGEKAFEPPWWGPRLDHVDFEVRPRGTKRLVCLSEHEAPITSGEIVVHAHVYHPPLYRNSESIRFPYPPLVELMVTHEALQIVARRQLSADKYIGLIREAFEESVRLNPAFPKTVRPRSLQGKPFTMNATIDNVYKER